MTVHREEPSAGAFLESIRDQLSAAIATLTAENERLRADAARAQSVIDAARAWKESRNLVETYDFDTEEETLAAAVDSYDTPDGES